MADTAPEKLPQFWARPLGQQVLQTSLLEELLALLSGKTLPQVRILSAAARGRELTFHLLADERRALCQDILRLIFVLEQSWSDQASLLDLQNFVSDNFLLQQKTGGPLVLVSLLPTYPTNWFLDTHSLNVVMVEKRVQAESGHYLPKLKVAHRLRKITLEGRQQYDLLAPWATDNSGEWLVAPLRASGPAGPAKDKAKASGPLRLWSTTSGEKVRDFRVPREGELRHISFAEDNKSILLVYPQELLELSIHSGRRIKKIRALGDLSLYLGAISPDKILIAALGTRYPSTVYLYHRETGLSHAILPTTMRIRSLGWWDQHHLWLVPENQGRIQLWNIKTKSQVAELSLPPGEKARAMSMDAQRRRIVVATASWQLYLYYAGQFSVPRPLERSSAAPLTQIKWGPGGDYFYATDASGIFQLWDLGKRSLLYTLSGFPIQGPVFYHVDPECEKIIRRK
jgi:hypothetical protein